MPTTTKKAKEPKDRPAVNFSKFKHLSPKKATEKLRELLQEGYRVEGRVNDKYVFDCTSGPIVTTGQHIDTDWQGAILEFKGKALTYFHRHSNTYKTAYSITAIQPDNMDSGSGAHGATKITISGNRMNDIQVGDVLRIFSQQLVDGFSANTYKAEYITAEYIKADGSNTAVYAQRDLSYSYAINASLKIAVVNQYTVQWRNCTIIQTNSQKTGGVASGGFELIGTYCPTFENVTFKNLSYPCFMCRSNYMPSFKTCRFINIMEEPPQSYGPPDGLSYGINDSGSFGLTALDLVGHNLRHVFTTGGNLNNFANPFLVGETIGARISGTAKACMHPFDTHEPGQGIYFVGCFAEGCGAGFQIRSRDTHIKGGGWNRCGTGIYIAINNSVFNKAFNYPITITGVSGEGTDLNAIKIVGSSSVQHRVKVSACDFAGAYVEVKNAELQWQGGTLDARRQEGTEKAYFLAVTGGAKVYVNNVKYITNSANVQSIFISGSGTNNTIHAWDIQVVNLATTSTLKFANQSDSSVTSNKLYCLDWKFAWDSPVKPSGTDLSSLVTNASKFAELRLSWSGKSMDKHIWNGKAWKTV